MIVAGHSHPVVLRGSSETVELDRLLAGLPRSSRRIAGALNGVLSPSVDQSRERAATDDRSERAS